MGSKAWDASGDVSIEYSIPWGAVRKGFLNYKNAIREIAKLTLNGLTYDFKKQAKEGLVVIQNGYTGLVFFLPDNREPMTAEQGESMTIQSYLTMLGTTDYAEIAAWDYFAKHVSGLLANTENPNIEIPYSILSVTGDTSVSESGTASFGSVTTAKDFFAVIANTVSSSANFNLSHWMEPDNAVSFCFSMTAGDQAMAFNLTVGRK